MKLYNLEVMAPRGLQQVMSVVNYSSMAIKLPKHVLWPLFKGLNWTFEALEKAILFLIFYSNSKIHCGFEIFDNKVKNLPHFLNTVTVSYLTLLNRTTYLSIFRLMKYQLCRLQSYLVNDFWNSSNSCLLNELKHMKKQIKRRVIIQCNMNNGGLLVQKMNEEI